MQLVARSVQVHEVQASGSAVSAPLDRDHEPESPEEGSPCVTKAASGVGTGKTASSSAIFA
jgi:hypothetical protein